MNTHAPHWLYRYYDAADRLLYVGLTGDLKHRESHHRARSPWFTEVARREDQEFPARHAGLMAEGEAIANEAPIHNRSRGMVYADTFSGRVGKILHAAMYEKGVSIEALAAATGISEQTIRRRTYGTRNFKVTELFLCCNALRLNVADVLAEADAA